MLTGHHFRVLRAESVYVLSVIALLLLVSQEAFALGGWYEDTGASFVSFVAGTLSAFKRICQVVLVIAGAGSLFFAIMSMLNGDSEGAKRFFIWLAGLAIGFALVSVMGGMKAGGGGGGVADAGAFSDFKVTVKSLMQILLIIVSMICVVRKVIQLINGEKEGGRELFKWFAVSTVGFALIGLM